MSSVIKNIYNKKTKGPTLMEFLTATGKLKKYRRLMCAPLVTRHTSIRYSSSCHTHVNMLTRVWQELDYLMLTRVWQELAYRIVVCPVTRGAHIEHL